jgi:hypothetical protein
MIVNGRVGLPPCSFSAASFFMRIYNLHAANESLRDMVGNAPVGLHFCLGISQSVSVTLLSAA